MWVRENLARPTMNVVLIWIVRGPMEKPARLTINIVSTCYSGAHLPLFDCGGVIVTFFLRGFFPNGVPIDEEKSFVPSSFLSVRQCLDIRLSFGDDDVDVAVAAIIMRKT